MFKAPVILAFLSLSPTIHAETPGYLIPKRRVLATPIPERRIASTSPFQEVSHPTRSRDPHKDFLVTLSLTSGYAKLESESMGVLDSQNAFFALGLDTHFKDTVGLKLEGNTAVSSGNAGINSFGWASILYGQLSLEENDVRIVPKLGPGLMYSSHTAVLRLEEDGNDAPSIIQEAMAPLISIGVDVTVFDKFTIVGFFRKSVGSLYGSLSDDTKPADEAEIRGPVSMRHLGIETYYQVLPAMKLGIQWHLRSHSLTADFESNSATVWESRGQYFLGALFYEL